MRLFAVRVSSGAAAAWGFQEADAGTVEPVRPLVLCAGRAAAWQAAHATTRTPQDPPALTRRGVVSRVCHSSRTGAVGIAEFVAVHIVLVKLPVAISTHQQFCVKYYYSPSTFRTPPVPSVFEDSPVYQPASQPRTGLSKFAKS